MRCTAKIKAWNPDYIKWNGIGIFTGNMLIYIQCPVTTKITSAKCWKTWRLCGHHAAQLHPDAYPKGSAPRKGGGRYGNDRNVLAFNQVVPIRTRRKSNKH